MLPVIVSFILTDHQLYYAIIPRLGRKLKSVSVQFLTDPITLCSYNSLKPISESPRNVYSGSGEEQGREIAYLCESSGEQPAAILRISDNIGRI